MSKWRMRIEMLGHRLRRHEVTEGGNVTITSAEPDGSFTFVVPPTFTCKTCGIEWCGELEQTVRDAALRRMSLGMRPKGVGDATK